MSEDNELEEIIEGLMKEKKIIRDVNKVDDYLLAYNMNNKKMMALLERLSEGYIFRWLYYICSKLEGLATENNFVDLLRKIISKIKSDMAQAPFIRALIKIGENNPELGFSLYKKMVITSESDLINYSSFPLGGAGKIDFEKAFAFIEKGLASKNLEEVVSSIKALRVIFEERTELQRTEEVFDHLDRLSKQEDQTGIQIEVMKAFFDFSKFSKKKKYCIKKLLEFAERENSDVRFNLATTLVSLNILDPETEMELVTKCAEDNNKHVLSRVAQALSLKGKKFPEKSMNIIKNWIIRGKYYNIPLIEYTINSIGKENQDRCIKEVKKWIREDNKRLEFFIPDIFVTLSSEDYQKLLDYLEIWVDKTEDLRKISLKTIKEILTKTYSTPKFSQEIVDRCYSILEKIAEEKGLDIQRILKGESEKVYQCLRLLNEIEIKRPELDYELVERNLQEYPTIKNFLGEKWFKNKIAERNKTHYLLFCLSSELDDNKIIEKTKRLKQEKDELRRYFTALGLKEMLRPIAFLQYLEGMLKAITSKSKKLKDLRNGLKIEEQFSATISEIEVISAFIEHYETEIAPSLEQKKLDVKVNFNGERVLIEVINPLMFKPARYLTGKAIGIPNRSRSLIYEEFKKHIKNIEINDIPVVIAINTGRSMITYDFVEDYLMGTLQLTFFVSKENGKVVDTKPTRAGDSMDKLDEETNLLSAVICYRSRFENDGKFHKEGKIITNPAAKNPLSNKVILEIEKLLFN
ncbi:hypothetical protein ACFLRN_01685 [Thermoproteota archaeon]